MDSDQHDTRDYAGFSKAKSSFSNHVTRTSGRLSPDDKMAIRNLSLATLCKESTSFLVQPVKLPGTADLPSWGHVPVAESSIVNRECSAFNGRLEPCTHSWSWSFDLPI